MSNNKKCFCGRVVEPKSDVCSAHLQRTKLTQNTSASGWWLKRRDTSEHRQESKPELKPELKPETQCKTAFVIFNTIEVLRVTYRVHGTDFVIVSFSTDPTALTRSVRAAGDLLDAQLENQASLLGIERLFILVNGTNQLVRTYEKQSQLKKWVN